MKNEDRIDKLIANKYDVSRAEASFLIEQGKVYLGKRQIIKSHSKIKIEDMDKIIIDQSLIDNIKTEMNKDLENNQGDEIEATDYIGKLEDIIYNITYEDEDILIINKKKNIVVYSGVGKENISVVSVLKDKYPLSNKNGEERAGIVHRLDKDTSGLLIIAKNNKAHSYYESLFKDRLIIKEYTALVKGIIHENKGKIDMPIARSSKDFKKMETSLKGKEAITYFEVLKRYQKYTLVKIRIETGRTHQIRVHFSQIGYPIVGDKKYSRGKNDFNLKSQFLHASYLEFDNINGNKLKINSELPDELNNIIKRLN